MANAPEIRRPDWLECSQPHHELMHIVAVSGQMLTTWYYQSLRTSHVYKYDGQKWYYAQPGGKQVSKREELGQIKNIAGYPYIDVDLIDNEVVQITQGLMNIELPKELVGELILALLRVQPIPPRR